MHLFANRSAFHTTLLTAVAPLLWGTTYIVTTEFLPPDRPLTSAAIRTLPAGVVLIALTRNRLPLAEAGRFLLLSAVNVSGFQTLLFVAAERLPGGLAALVGALQPLLVMTLLWAFERVRPGPFSLGSATAGVLGMSLVFVQPYSVWDPVGMAAAFLGTALLAVGSVLSRRWQNGMPVAGFAGWQLFFGGLMLLPFAVLLEPGLPPLSLQQGLGYAYLTLVGTLLAYPLWMNGLARLPALAVSALSLLSPIAAITLGWFFLGQVPGSRGLAGIFVILASVVTLQFTPVARPRQTLPQSARC